MRDKSKQARFARFGRLVECLLRRELIDGGTSIDVDELADVAVACGMMTQVPFDPANHGNQFCDHDYEPGDLIYWWGE